MLARSCRCWYVSRWRTFYFYSVELASPLQESGEHSADWKNPFVQFMEFVHAVEWAFPIIKHDSSLETLEKNTRKMITSRRRGSRVESKLKKRWKSENLDEFFISIFTRELCSLSVVVSREDYTIIVNNVVCCFTTHETHSWVGGLSTFFSSASSSSASCAAALENLQHQQDKRRKKVNVKNRKRLKITSGNNSFVFRTDIQLLLLRNEIIHTTTTQLDYGGS